MVPYCTSCYLLGSVLEKYIGTTLDKCKSMCLDDPKCLALEFGKEGEKFEGRCLLNSESVDFKNSSKVDAWIRTTDCGNWLFFKATKCGRMIKVYWLYLSIFEE